MKGIELIIHILWFTVAFIGVHLALGFTSAYWTNLIYAGGVLISLIVCRKFVFYVISWAIFPYSNTMVGRNHQQGINR